MDRRAPSALYTIKNIKSPREVFRMVLQTESNTIY